jgi:hypothetical protein
MTALARRVQSALRIRTQAREAVQRRPPRRGHGRQRTPGLVVEDVRADLDATQSSEAAPRGCGFVDLGDMAVILDPITA